MKDIYEIRKTYMLAKNFEKIFSSMENEIKKQSR